MKNKIFVLNAKKVFLAASLAVGLFLIAGQAMAAAYAQGVKIATGTPSQSAVGQQQNQVYPIMGAFGVGGNSAINYRPMAFAAQSALPYRAASSMALMVVITIALVWVVLIQLIFLLAKLLKKHNRE